MIFYVTKALPFDKLSNKYSISEKRIKKLRNKLQINPFVGDLLQTPILREKRFDGKRVYFLVFADEKVVILVAISNKKAQQETIDNIISMIPQYKQTAINIRVKLERTSQK